MAELIGLNDWIKEDIQGEKGKSRHEAVDHTARKFGVSITTVYAWIKQGNRRIIRKGKKVDLLTLEMTIKA